MARLKRAPRVVFRRGRYVCDYYDDKGRRQRPSFKTKSEALDLKRRIMAARLGLGGEPTAAATAVSIKEAVRKYVEIETSRKSCRRQEEKWFEDFFDFLHCDLSLDYLHEIKKPDLIKYQRRLSKTLCNATVNRRFTSFKHFFNVCVDWEYLEASPAERLKSLPVQSVPRKMWTDEQITAVLSELSEMARYQLYFLAETGGRPIEARQLTWGDVDRERNTVRLYSRKGTGEKRIRYVPMSLHLRSMIDRLFESARREFRAKDSDLVFSSREFKNYRTSLAQAVRRARERLGFEDIQPYGLRHTLSTRLVESGKNLEVVRMLLGHANLRTTERYLHVNEKSLHAAINDFSQQRRLEV